VIRLALLLVVLISGCAPTFQVAPPEQQVASATRIRDLRPSEERDGKLLPYGREISADMLGDRSFKPDRLSLLEHRLLQRFGSISSAEVRNFSVVLLLPRTTPLNQIIFPNMPASVKGITDFSTTWVIVEARGNINTKAFDISHAEPFPRQAFGRQDEVVQKALAAAIEKVISAVEK